MNKSILSLNQISKSFYEFKFKNFFLNKSSERQIFKKFSINILDSEIIGITGKNGTGKTTLLRILSGLTHYDSGEFHNENNVSVRYICPNERSFFWRLSLIENLRLFASFADVTDQYSEEKIEYYLNYFELYGHKDTEFMRLSSGQKKKLIIIRGLLSDSKVLLFDEVTSNLDKKSQKLLYKEVKHLRDNENKTIVWVSHDENELSSLSDRLISLDK